MESNKSLTRIMWKNWRFWDSLRWRAVTSNHSIIPVLPDDTEHSPEPGGSPRVFLERQEPKGSTRGTHEGTRKIIFLIGLTISSLSVSHAAMPIVTSLGGLHVPVAVSMMRVVAAPTGVIVRSAKLPPIKSRRKDRNCGIEIDSYNRMT